MARIPLAFFLHANVKKVSEQSLEKIENRRIKEDTHANVKRRTSGLQPEK